MRKESIVAAIVYLLINGLFILKYAARTPLNPVMCLAAYVIIIFAAAFIYRHIPQRHKKHIEWSLLIGMTLAIVAALVLIDPMTVRVDRWSATTYFLDALFSGQYPYGVHTHVCDTNYPSPFPLWHYLNIPFWLMGDVGIGLIAVLWMTFMPHHSSYIHNSTQTHNSSSPLLLLALSPAYWWEVAVRSDGLSNALLVLMVIVWLDRKHFSFQNKWLLTAVVCGLVASTRLSAIIPLALYLMYSYLRAEWKVKLAAPLVAIMIVFLMFAPYIFWDTDTWIFFSRNPFMSQTSTGNLWTLLLMVGLAIAMFGLKKFDNDDANYGSRNAFSSFSTATAAYLTLFFSSALCYNHFIQNADIPLWNDADFDISYFTLALPYCITGLVQNKQS